MPKFSTDILFDLIQSLEKAEKRHFKLFIRRNWADSDLKIIALFDTLDKMTAYEETLLLQKAPQLQKGQLHNLKAHLYRQILTSLRLLKTQQTIDLQLGEQLDFARILYHKGLYIQSLRLLDKVKTSAQQHHQGVFFQQALSVERKILSLHKTKLLEEKAEALTADARNTSQQEVRVSEFSNLALRLYHWYILHGHARNEADIARVKDIFEVPLSTLKDNASGFYERLYLYQSQCWYSFILQDFLGYYRYTRKWVRLFDEEPQMLKAETDHYIRGMHNLLTAHFDLQNDAAFEDDLRAFEQFAATPLATESDNNRIQTFVFLHQARLNLHFTEGTFREGLEWIPTIEAGLKSYARHLDPHRVLVFYYKFACLYFGSGDYENTISWLNKIIHWKVDLRMDLQCYARLLHLIAHYELGNSDILEYLIKSVYRFMYRMQNMGVVEEEVLQFLRRSFHVPYKKLKPEFEDLLKRLKSLQASRYETRAFSYLDIISWLESKISGKLVDAVIREKHLRRVGATS